MNDRMQNGSPAVAELSAIAALTPPLHAMAESVRACALAVVATGARRKKIVAAESPPPDDDEAEAVHDFRVALRRLRTVLRVVRKLYGRRRIRAVSTRLKRYADATGTLRNEEVLRETLASLELEPGARSAALAWIGRRARQEKLHRGSVVKLLRAELESGLGAALSSLEDTLARGPERAGELPLRELSRASIDRACSAIHDAGQVDPADSAAMHELRILFKRLRYTAELFLSVAPGGDAHERQALAALAKGATRMQKRLGEVHDLDEALIKMGRAWGLAPEPRAAVVLALRASRDRVAQRAISDLTAERAAHDAYRG